MFKWLILSNLNHLVFLFIEGLVVLISDEGASLVEVQKVVTLSLAFVKAPFLLNAVVFHV